MIKNQQYHHHEVSDNKWSLHYKLMDKNKQSNDKSVIMNVIKWYTMIYCVKRIRILEYIILYHHILKLKW